MHFISCSDCTKLSDFVFENISFSLSRKQAGGRSQVHCFPSLCNNALEMTMAFLIGNNEMVISYLQLEAYIYRTENGMYLWELQERLL